MLILYGKVGKVDTHFTFFTKAKQTEQRINFLAFNKPKQAKQRLLLNCFQQSRQSRYLFLLVCSKAKQRLILTCIYKGKVGKVATHFLLFLFLLVFKRLSPQSREFTSCFWQRKEGKVRINLISFRKAKYLEKVENYLFQLAKQRHMFICIYKGRVGKVEN